jgi:hypothetical protein
VEIDTFARAATRFMVAIRQQHYSLFVRLKEIVRMPEPWMTPGEEACDEAPAPCPPSGEDRSSELFLSGWKDKKADLKH